MGPTILDRRALTIALILITSGQAEADSTYVDHYRAAMAAHAAGDIAGFRDQLLRVGAMIGEQPGVNYNLACAAARIGDRTEALRRLELYAASRLVRDAAADSDFVASYQKVFAEATARFPTYHRWYTGMALHLMPRWYGREGDLERFAGT